MVLSYLKQLSWLSNFWTTFCILHVDTWDIPIDMLLFPDITLIKGLFVHTGHC